MAMMTWLTRTLRNDRGDASPISLVMGSILTLIAALIIGGALTTMLGATTLAQSNSDLTTLMEREIRQFEQTPFSNLVEEEPHRYEITASGRKVSIEREVFYDTEARSYTLRLTAPRAVIANKTPKVCATLDSEGKTPKGCFSLSSTIVGTPADLGPVLPTGVTVSVRNVDGKNTTSNLVAHNDFEQEGAAAAWGATGNGATIENTSTPRLTGSKELVLTQNTVIYSQPVPFSVAESIKSQAWVFVEAGAAQVSVGTSANETTPAFGTSVTGKKWTLASGNASFSSSGSYRVAIRVTGCEAGCKVRVDDVTSLRLTENLMRNTDKYILSTGVTKDATTGAITTTGTGTSTITYPMPSPAMKGINQVTFGTRIVAASNAAATGTIKVAYTAYNGSVTELAAATLDGISTEGVPLSGLVAIPEGEGGMVTITVQQTGGTAKPVTFSSNFLLATGRTNPDAVDAPSMEVARLDPTEIKNTILRVSYQYDGTLPAEDLRIGVFCTTELGTGSLSTNKMYLSQDTQNRNWYWSRLEIPALDRLGSCEHANIRVWSQNGTVIESSLVKNVSVMKVLDGITARNHGTDNGEDDE